MRKPRCPLKLDPMFEWVGYWKDDDKEDPLPGWQIEGELADAEWDPFKFTIIGGEMTIDTADYDHLKFTEGELLRMLKLVQQANRLADR